MKKEAVFVHAPKTGGASILQICMHHGIKVIDHDLRNPNYLSLEKYRAHNPNIYSFAVVRNPWDRLVSSYHYLKMGGINRGDKADAGRFVNRFASFNDFVLEAFQDNEILQQIHFRPQYKWISDDNGVIVDQVGRFEKLQLHSSRWFKSIGLPNYKLPHVNKSEHKPYKQYYSDESIKIVGNVYIKDIELFKYTF